MKNTENTTTTTAADNSADYPSITTGGAAVPFTSALHKQIDARLPGFIADIHKSGYINGSKFYNIYLRYNLIKNKKSSEKYIFFSDATTPKNISALPIAAKNGKKIINYFPKNVFPSIDELHNAVFTITVTYRGQLFRTLHINLNH